MLELLGGPDSAILVINSSPEAAHFLRRSSSLEAVRKLKESKRRTSRRLQLAFTKLRNGVERGHTPFVSSLVSPREGRPRATETEGRLAGGEAEQTRDRETREGVGGFGDPKRERPEEERSPHFVLSCTLRDEAERETEELTTTEEDKQTRKAQAGENRTGATETRQRDIRLSFLCLLPYTFLSCAVTVFSALVPSTLFLVRSPSLSPCTGIGGAEGRDCSAASGNATLSGVPSAASGEKHASASTWTKSTTLEVAVQETLQQAAVFAVMLAMWGIGVVYFATRRFLKGFNLGLKFLCIKVLVVVIQVSEIVAKFRGSPTYEADVAVLSSFSPPPEFEGAFLELHHSVFDFVLLLLALPVTLLALRTFDPRELFRLEERSPAFGGVPPAVRGRAHAGDWRRDVDGEAEREQA
ncbi:conserved hypothetical protein [Neospora caninum Liverpool]|uniref:Transmembrane protein n=1 Tax=Neospora caninum (strain Liverpool) TaxID=572307 RepID=F0VJR0_NEOCL|nr:conserved hypothetical protein [Neospora caninum Liverpool]CBZ53971.1 conserved hypothetical protein [Neospora caninum Liverpool]|eukprot:XP_003884003.1 conserved hypothetical protein [Neospora caninum Liverpool]